MKIVPHITLTIFCSKWWSRNTNKCRKG